MNANVFAKIVPATCLIVVVTLVLAILLKDGGTQSLTSTASCENWSRADWDAYLARISRLDRFLYQVPEQMAMAVEATMQSCPANVQKNQIVACTERILAYGKQFTASRVGLFSTLMPDDQYLALQPPEAMKLPAELQSAAHGLPKNWRAVANKNGWKYALFCSNTNIESRLVMFLPGQSYDRMLLYFCDGVNPDPTTYPLMQMDVVVKKENGVKLKKPKQYFRTLAFGEDDLRPTSQSSTGGCVGCHVNGPRAIEPRKRPAFPTELGGVENIDQLNSLLVHDEIFDLNLYYDLKTMPTHLQVGRTWGCNQCHDGDRRRSLALSLNLGGSFNKEDIYNKIVVDQTMPIEEGRPSVTPEMRPLIAADIEKDYYEQLSAWLIEHKCGPSP